MSAIETSVIVCAGCQRQFAWKPQLAGKRVKCKCGQVISVPGNTAVATPPKPVPVKKAIKPAPDDLDALFALADDAERAAAVMPIEVREVPDPVVEAKPARQKKTGPGIPLGYQRGPTARETQRAIESRAALVDPVRDLYAPLGILVVGFLIYIAFFIVRFNLPSAAVGPVGFGVVVLTVLKAALLIGFALMVATPLGVSFGGVGSAILKLAAIAVFVDGVVAFVDMGVGKISGGFGGSGVISFGPVGWPVALGLYWGLLIYLFSMDPGDSWMVVVCLTVFDRIMRIVLLMLLLETFLGWGGVHMPAATGSGSGSHSSKIHNSVLSTHVDDLKEADALVEAKKYIEDGHQAILTIFVKGWYDNGCPNVWFEMSGRDINGKRSAQGVIVELPQGKAQRAKCYDLLKQYYEAANIGADPAELTDTGEDYMEVNMR